MKIFTLLFLLFLSMNVFAHVKTLPIENVGFILAPYVFGEHELKKNELKKYEPINIKYTINANDDMLWSYYVHPEVVFKLSDIVEMNVERSEIVGDMKTNIILSQQAGEKLYQVTSQNINGQMGIINPKTQELIYLANIVAELESELAITGYLHPELLKMYPDLEVHLMHFQPKQGYEEVMLKYLNISFDIPMYIHKYQKITPQHIEKFYIVHDKKAEKYHIVLELKNNAKEKIQNISRIYNNPLVIIGLVHQEKYLGDISITPERYFSHDLLPKSIKNPERFIILKSFYSEYDLTEFLEKIQINQ